MTVANYIETCLIDPQLGYYNSKDPLGITGDFITAPEISQMFGELLGAWMGNTWCSMGRPAPIQIIELGPGRGTLMADAVRGIAPLKGFLSAIRINFLEVSPVLRRKQARAISELNFGLKPLWWNNLSDIPSGPAIIIANEFLDALPTHQFIMTDLGWRERLIGIKKGQLAFVISNNPPRPLNIPKVMPRAQLNDIYEVCPAAIKIIAMLASRIKKEGGAALLIDYARPQGCYGDTLQAVRKNKKVGIFENPGEDDLTTMVDFLTCVRTAEKYGILTYGPVSQGSFLNNLGISLRAATLLKNATPQQAINITASKNRLVSNKKMGQLFQVLAILNSYLPTPAGFEKNLINNIDLT